MDACAATCRSLPARRARALGAPVTIRDKAKPLVNRPAASR
jgi:hypothetical protein